MFATGSRSDESRLRPIELVRIGSEELPPTLLPELAKRLAGALEVKVREGRPLHLPQGFDPNDALTAGVDRLSSNALVDALIARQGARDESLPPRWTVAVTARDLYAPHRRFVYGEATLGGAWAVVSIARFGAAGDPSPRLRDRLYKEVLHEIAHLAGLSHCASRACPACRAERVEEIDTKETEFCEDCRRLLFPAKQP